MATTSSKQTCNCSAKAYPKYSKTPSAVVPMPALNTQPCKGCGAEQVCVAAFNITSVHLLKPPLLTHVFLSQLVFSSEPWTSYLQTQVKSLCSKELQRGDNSSFITVSMPGFKYKYKPTWSYLYDLIVWISVYLTCFFPVTCRWMRWPCPSLSLGISWSQWMPALGKSPRKPHLPRWMPRWNST